MCYMYYVDNKDLGRVLHLLCEPHGPVVVCYMYYVEHRDLGSCVTCIMWTTDTWGRVLHVLCGPQRPESCITCMM